MKVLADRLKILFVDENQNDSKLFLNFAREKFPHWQVDHIDSIDKSKEFLATKPELDVMFVSLDQDPQTALDVLKEFKPVVSSVALSSEVDEDLAQRALEAGAYDFVVKEESNVALVAPMVKKILYRIDQKKQMAELQETLATSNKELEQFAYIISHDLNEPLRTVKSFCKLLEVRYSEKIDDEGKEFINFISNGCTRMQELIADLLAFSRASSKELEIEDIESSVILKEVLSGLEAKIQETNAEIIMPDFLPKIKAHKHFMEQVFQNLIANSLKFCKQKPVIEIQSKDLANGFVEFAVKDNGIGIKEEFFERIFEVFQRLHTREEFEGTGVGLSLCKKIVERHGGEIDLQSTYGEGTRISFTLQIA